MNRMNVVYTTNDVFCGKVAAGITSIWENNKDFEDITVYVVGMGITEESEKRFEKMAAEATVKENGIEKIRHIKMVELKELSEYIPFEFDTLGWNPIVLARLILDKLLPEDIDRILYVDGDTICLRSLKNLWNVDLKGKVLGGCIEATVNRERLKELDLYTSPYINAGVLLIDLKKWREENWGGQILEYYRQHNGLLFANDQDAINATAKGNILYLSPKYNFYNIYWFYPYRYLKKLMKTAPYYSKSVYDEAMEHPTIIHYLGEERPWRHGNKHKFKADYVKYLAMTPWKDEEEEAGWETYFKVWGLFNLVMKPFPALRYHIIDGLIPLFMKWRKKQRTKK